MLKDREAFLAGEGEPSLEIPCTQSGWWGHYGRLVLFFTVLLLLWEWEFNRCYHYSTSEKLF
jgi:hypothetical protein